MRPTLSKVILAAFLATVCRTTPAQTTYTALVDPNLVLVDSFEGWGVSLCWWANVVGGYANRATYASLAFTQLKLNIVRYNIGGGENPGIANTMEYRARIPGFEPSPGVWDWSADANQRWMLRQAVSLGADRVVAFANSPPWWMTVSGSVTGSTNGTSNNLQTNYETAFTTYMATVMSNLTVLDGVSFESATPLNEPTAGWWKYGGHQEGCHISSDQQARLVSGLRTALDARNQAAVVAASEDNDEQSALSSVSAYSAAALNSTARLVTHTYGANNPVGLRNFSAMQQKPLWVSEYGDGDASGMRMARRIHDDLAVMWARAWVYWQVVDNAGGWGFLYNPLDGSGNTTYTINKKFYVMGQFSEFIRPGSRLLSVNDANSLAAYNPTNQTLTIVAVNDSTNTLTVAYDLSRFSSLPGSYLRYRTSPTENLATLGSSPFAGTQLASALPPQSVTTYILPSVVPAPASSKPRAWYPFEGSAADVSGNGNSGALSGSVGFVSGKLGALAAQFDGVSGYAQIPRSISNHFTISFWVKTTATAATGQWWNGKGLVDGEVAGTVDDFGVTLLGGKAGFGVGNPDTTISSTASINDGQWHHVAATRDAVSGKMCLYVDGAFQTSALGPTGTKAAPPVLRIGSIQAGYSGGFLLGAVDDVQLFDRVFGPAEIGQLMNHPPVLPPLPDVSVLAGTSFNVTNAAHDPDQPAQTLTFSLLSPVPGGLLNVTNGLLMCRPPIGSSPSVTNVAIIVSDNGTPVMRATQSFLLTISRPASPRLFGPVWSNGLVSLQVQGDPGPDYVFEAASNLTSPVQWGPLDTNLSPVPPFWWTDSRAGSATQRYYRVRLGP